MVQGDSSIYERECEHADPTTTTTQATTPLTIEVQIKKDHHGWTIEAEDPVENDKRFRNV